MIMNVMFRIKSIHQMECCLLEATDGEIFE